MLQDRLLDEHRSRADRVAAGRRPRLPAPGVHRAGRAARARRLPLHRRRSGRRRRRQRQPVDDPGQRRRLHRPGPRTRPGSASARTPISEFRVIDNRFDTEIGGTAGGALSIVTKSGTNAVRRHGLRLLPRRRAARAGRARHGRRPTTPAPSSASPSAARSSATRTHFFVSFEQINEDNVVLFRPGGAFTATPSDIGRPFDQTLVFGSVDHHQLGDQNLRHQGSSTSVPRRRTSASAASSTSYGRDAARIGDNWNFTPSTSGARRAARSTSCASRRRAQVRRADQLRRGRPSGFLSGNTLQTGANILGDQLDTGRHVRAARHLLQQTRQRRGRTTSRSAAPWHRSATAGTSRSSARPLHLRDRHARLPLAYVDGEGRATLICDNALLRLRPGRLRPRRTCRSTSGLRYDLDNGGNNPGFTHPLVPGRARTDTNDFQPRARSPGTSPATAARASAAARASSTAASCWSPPRTSCSRTASPAASFSTRVNGALLGLPALHARPNNPDDHRHSAATRHLALAPTLETPESTQAAWLHRVSSARRPLLPTSKGVYVEGDNEIVIRDVNLGGNAARAARCRTRLQPDQHVHQRGRSRVQGVRASLNGTLKGGHLSPPR